MISRILSGKQQASVGMWERLYEATRKESR
jgi:hypothetical protein